MATTLGKSHPPAVKRRRGAPPGNANAFKHGFYSARLTPVEKQTIQHQRTLGLHEQIRMVDDAILDLLETTSGDDTLSWKQALDQLRTVTLAVTAKASLMRLQANLQNKLAEIDGMQDRLAEFFSNVAGEVAEPPAEGSLPFLSRKTAGE
jgi:hypothetical protein